MRITQKIEKPAFALFFGIVAISLIALSILKHNAGRDTTSTSDVMTTRIVKDSINQIEPNIVSDGESDWVAETARYTLPASNREIIVGRLHSPTRGVCSFGYPHDTYVYASGKLMSFSFGAPHHFFVRTNVRLIDAARASHVSPDLCEWSDLEKLLSDDRSNLLLLYDHALSLPTELSKPEEWISQIAFVSHNSISIRGSVLTVDYKTRGGVKYHARIEVETSERPWRLVRASKNGVELRLSDAEWTTGMRPYESKSK